MQMKKGDIIEDVQVETMAAEGKCVAKLNGQVLFVSGAAPGDVVDVSLTKIKTSFLEGHAVTIKKLSPYRATPFCSHFGTCGGCSWQHIQYPTQLQYKQQQVIDNLERIGGLTLPVIQPILGSSSESHYRNKLDYTFTANRWLTKEEMTDGVAFGDAGLGYHIPRMYDKVFDVTECYLQPDPSNAIRLAVKDIAVSENIPFFDLRKQTGFLRTLTLRNTAAGDVMIILQVTYDKMEWTEKILNRLEKDFPKSLPSTTSSTVKRTTPLPTWTSFAGRGTLTSQRKWTSRTAQGNCNSALDQNHFTKPIPDRPLRSIRLPGTSPT